MNQCTYAVVEGAFAVGGIPGASDEFSLTAGPWTGTGRPEPG